MKYGYYDRSTFTSDSRMFSRVSTFGFTCSDSVWAVDLGVSEITEGIFFGLLFFKIEYLLLIFMNSLENCSHPIGDWLSITLERFLRMLEECFTIQKILDFVF